ncbi:hypothetical protein F4677DRAFT_319710 [Hypoxylon crocopeplum]|nr:hypothetical protein F4677DRAFT_319710 [Hypoxylon crocopeplum]
MWSPGIRVSILIFNIAATNYASAQLDRRQHYANLRIGATVTLLNGFTIRALGYVLKYNGNFSYLLFSRTAKPQATYRYFYSISKHENFVSS